VVSVVEPPVSDIPENLYSVGPGRFFLILRDRQANWPARYQHNAGEVFHAEVESNSASHPVVRGSAFLFNRLEEALD